MAKMNYDHSCKVSLSKLLPKGLLQNIAKDKLKLIEENKQEINETARRNIHH